MQKQKATQFLSSGTIIEKTFIESFYISLDFQVLYEHITTSVASVIIFFANLAELGHQTI